MMGKSLDNNEFDEEKLLKQTGLFSKFTNYSLYITVALVIFAQWRISNHDIKLLYSLCMVMSAAVGRYGTDLTYSLTKYKPDKINKGNRGIVYNILWLFGLLGLIF